MFPLLCRGARDAAGLVDHHLNGSGSQTLLGLTGAGAVDQVVQRHSPQGVEEEGQRRPMLVAAGQKDAAAEDQEAHGQEVRQQHLVPLPPGPLRRPPLRVPLAPRGRQLQHALPQLLLARLPLPASHPRLAQRVCTAGFPLPLQFFLQVREPLRHGLEHAGHVDAWQEECKCAPVRPRKRKRRDTSINANPSNHTMHARTYSARCG